MVGIWIGNRKERRYFVGGDAANDLRRTIDRQGQRCIIPAAVFWEPNWEGGKNQWWRFKRADGRPWALAGLWSTWIDKTSGEVIESYTMLTMNADSHPLMRRMHKPDPKLGPTEQDKRSVVVLEAESYDTWLGVCPTRPTTGMNHFVLASGSARPCWYCHWFDGMTAQNTCALCLREGGPRVRSDPQNGCSCWQREPGSDDEQWAPISQVMIATKR